MPIANLSKSLIVCLSAPEKHPAFFPHLPTFFQDTHFPFSVNKEKNIFSFTVPIFFASFCAF